jgi:hypothetical protein
MAGKSFLTLFLACAAAVLGCSEDEPRPDPPKQNGQTVIVRPKPKVMTPEQQAELAFPPDVIAEVESAAGGTAEPFYEEVLVRSANLKGDVMIAAGRLCGFSVRTRRADELVDGLSRSLRARGFLIFRSAQNVGSVPDVVTVVRGGTSYDILKVQRTESPHYHLDTKTIIAWLREQQKLGSFVVTGAGPDWVEARFITPPKNMRAFARRVASFAPDVLREGPGTVERLADRMEETDGFRLVWD